MLLITVATTALPGRRPSRLQLLRAHAASRRRRRRRGRGDRRRSRGRRRRRTRRPGGAALARTVARQRSRVRRSAAQVDVAAVGRRRRSASTSKPSSGNSRGATVARRAVGAVDDDARSASAVADRQDRPQVLQVVRRRGPPVRPVAAAAAGTVPRRVGHDRLRPARSSARVNFSPAPENTLMPLSSNGLCDAEITTPASKPRGASGRPRRASGTTPALVTAGARRRRRARSRSIQSPDSRVSRPSALAGPAGASNAAPTRRRCASSGNAPAEPATVRER